MRIVAGLSLRNLKPRVWDSSSPYFIPELQAVMVSYADLHHFTARRKRAMTEGLRQYLGVPSHVRVYLDNGAFYFLNRGGEVPREEYEAFVTAARPDWWPIPQDYIPVPKMSRLEQATCFARTMRVNLQYQRQDYVPIIHIGRFLPQYMAAVRRSCSLSRKHAIALGGIVPNLLRAPRAMAPRKILAALRAVRQAFPDKGIHVFGVGGTATIHLAALLGFDSVDSSGWRNRAARGLVQLSGTGDRVVAELGKWRGRRPSAEEWESLRTCRCPACRLHGLDGLRARAIAGFCNRATHNLWVLLQEAQAVDRHLQNGTYERWYVAHLDNTVYRPLIREALELDGIAAAAPMDSGPAAVRKPRQR